MKKFSADKSELGFEYQFYFFLWKLLEMTTTGETVAWEVKDDVSLDLPDGTCYLFQIKHTIQKKSDETPINMTDLDYDLWKTMSNWSQLIKSKGKVSEQKIFLQKTFFVLATNKGESKNSILEKFENFLNNNIDFSDLKLEILSLQTKTNNKIINEYIGNCLKLGDKVLELFFQHLQFQLEQENLIQRCKDAIKGKMISTEKIDMVYDSLYSNIRNDNYITIQAGNPVSISFEDFHKKYRRCFEQYRSGELIINRNGIKLPNSIDEQIFIKQLIDIGDVESNDLDIKLEYTRFKLLLERNLEEWYQAGDITGLEKDEFLNDGINQWKNEFHSKYRGLVDSTQYNEKGCQIIDELRKRNLNINNQTLSNDMSNGTFYHLADIPKIGFTKDWEAKYEK